MKSSDVRFSTWRHLNFFQHHCYIHASVPRVKCPEHGVKRIEVPWARKGSAFTLLLEQAALTLVREKPLAADVFPDDGAKEMRKLGIFLNITLITSMGVANSFANDTSMWYDGLYVGGQLGYTDGEAVHTFSNDAPTGDSQPNGVDIGLFIGLQKRIRNLLVGIEIDYNKSNADGDFLDPSGFTSAGSTEFSSTYSIRAKLGYPLQNLGLVPYVTGGAAFADVDIQGGPAFSPTGGRYSASYSGWTAGIGMERPIDSQFTARLELRYSDYGSEEGSLSPGFPTVEMPVDLETRSVQLGIYYHW